MGADLDTCGKRACDVDDKSNTDPKKPCSQLLGFQCTYTGCDKTFGQKCNMERHFKAVHDGIKNVMCIKSNCDKTFRDKYQMLQHIKAVHDGIKNFECTVPNCEKTFSAKGDMLRHVSTVHEGTKNVECSNLECNKLFCNNSDMQKHLKAVHNGIADIECTYPNCDKKFSSKGNMMVHVKSVHDGIKDFLCTYPGCSKKFSGKGNMLQHFKAVHDGIKDIKCIYINCNRTFSTKCSMLKHVKIIHDGVKDVMCTVPDCYKVFSSKGNMLQHIKMFHECVRDIQCTYPDCRQMFSRTRNMLMHYQCWHTKEGQQRKIRKQDRVRHVLESAYTVDSECHVRYQGGCVPDPDKFCARVDYHILGITNSIVIVECDEEGHRDYTLACELSRMEQIHEAIIKANYSLMVENEGETYALTTPMKPVVFVRFNPDARKVDGEKERWKRADREALLLELLQEIRDGDVDLPHPLNIVYIGYDMLDGEPVVCGDPDFAQQMCGCVVLAV